MSILLGSTNGIVLVPSPEGIAMAKELALTKGGRVLTDSEAEEILAKLMSFIYLTNVPCSDTPCTQESRTTTAP